MRVHIGDTTVQPNTFKQLNNSLKHPPLRRHLTLRSVMFHTVDYLILHFVDRVQRVHRTLRHQCEVLQPNLPHLFFIKGQQVNTIELHLAACDQRRRFVQTHQRHRHRSLPRA